MDIRDSINQRVKQVVEVSPTWQEKIFNDVSEAISTLRRKRDAGWVLGEDEGPAYALQEICRATELSVEYLRGGTPLDQLLTIYLFLTEAEGVSNERRTFYLEALSCDASTLCSVYKYQLGENSE